MRKRVWRLVLERRRKRLAAVNLCSTLDDKFFSFFFPTIVYANIYDLVYMGG